MKGCFYPLASGLDDCPLPQKVKDVMADELFRGVAWVGKDVIDEAVVAFTVVLAHELAHVEQFLYEPQIHHVGNLILAYLRRLPPAERAKYTYFDSPTEWDAESRARQVAVALHGEDAVHSYMNSKRITPFINPRPTQTLPEVVESLKTWLHGHQDGILAMLNGVHVPDPLLELASRVDWAKFGLAAPLSLTD